MENLKDEAFQEELRETNRIANKKFIVKNDECKKIITELKKLEIFLDDMSSLSFGRDYILCGKRTFSLHMVLNSLELTMGNIISCCENASIADANSLLRKYRDDIFFYLYVLVYDSILKRDITPQVRKDMELKITDWINNELKNFNINQVLKAIANSDDLKDAVEKYNLKKSFSEIGVHLNNYVHSNGKKHYNQVAFTYEPDELLSELKNIVNNAKYITVVFIFLLTLCSPHLIMADDYIDYLDFGETPPKDSQYWVAPFVERFVKDNITLIDKSCLDYLKDYTVMQFNL